jgi:hypothetical protein
MAIKVSNSERKTMKITNILATVLLVTAAANASQDAPQAAPATQTAPECKDAAESKCDLFDASRFKFVETVQYVDFDNGADGILSLNQSVLWTYDEFTTLHVDLPVISSGDTGIGMMEIGFDHKFIRKPCDFIDSVALGFDFELPTGEDRFGGDDVNIEFGFDIDGKTPNASLGWNAGFDWTVNQDATYVPVLGGLVYDNVINFYAGLDYSLCDKMSVGFGYDYWDADEDNYFSSIGPSFSWVIANNVDFNCGVDFVIDQGSANSADTVTQFGLGIKF